jgi:hypothetical protein
MVSPHNSYYFVVAVRNVVEQQALELVKHSNDKTRVDLVLVPEL